MERLRRGVLRGLAINKALAGVSADKAGEWKEHRKKGAHWNRTEEE